MADSFLVDATTKTCYLCTRNIEAEFIGILRELLTHTGFVGDATVLSRTLLYMQITELRQRVHHGDQKARSIVIPLIYGELKKLATGHLRPRGQGAPARYDGAGP